MHALARTPRLDNPSYLTVTLPPRTNTGLVATAIEMHASHHRPHGDGSVLIGFNSREDVVGFIRTLELATGPKFSPTERDRAPLREAIAIVKAGAQEQRADNPIVQPGKTARYKPVGNVNLRRRLSAVERDYLASAEPCASCGAPLHASDKFCMKCGLRVARAANPARRRSAEEVLSAALEKHKDVKANIFDVPEVKRAHARFMREPKSRASRSQPAPMAQLGKREFESRVRSLTKGNGRVNGRGLFFRHQILGSSDGLNITFINLPEDLARQGGAMGENNRMSFWVRGFDAHDEHAPPPSGKVKIEQASSALPRDFKLRAKTGTPEQIAQYFASFLKKVTDEVHPRFTNTFCGHEDCSRRPELRASCLDNQNTGGKHQDHDERHKRALAMAAELGLPLPTPITREGNPVARAGRAPKASPKQLHALARLLDVRLEEGVFLGDVATETWNELVARGWASPGGPNGGTPKTRHATAAGRAVFESSPEYVALLQEFGRPEVAIAVLARQRGRMQNPTKRYPTIRANELPFDPARPFSTGKSTAGKGFPAFMSTHAFERDMDERMVQADREHARREAQFKFTVGERVRSTRGEEGHVVSRGWSTTFGMPQYIVSIDTVDASAPPYIAKNLGRQFSFGQTDLRKP